MKFVWAFVFLLTMATITQAQAQAQTKAKTSAPGKSFGELARAERNRQQKATPTKTVDIQVASVDKPEDKDPKTGATIRAKTEKAPDPMEPKPITAQDIEIAQLQQEKTDLLMQLSNVIRDRKAVDDIQQRLSEIQKRVDELKQSPAKAAPHTK